MNGKSKCKILKDIRKKIAAENDIVYVTSECKHKGDCTGTCPKCEQELRYLEEQLRLRKRQGKAVAVAGIAAAMVVTAAGCTFWNQEPEVLTGAPVLTEPATENTDGESLPGRTDLPPEEGLAGFVPPEELMGEPTETGPELMGDIAVETEG